jgi:hypothetical protein
MAGAALLLLTSACGDMDPTPVGTAGGEFKSEVKLAALFPATADLVGVAVTAEGRRYLLDRNSGLYELGASSARLVFPISELATRFGLSPDTELTDVVALDSMRFAVTAENDGFMLDLEASTFSSYFCYFPAPSPTDTPPTATPPVVVVPTSVSQELRRQGIAVKERTESVAFSPERSQLFAQPQTIRLDTGEIVGSELFVFRDSGGQPIEVRPMPSSSFLAGGMIAIDGLRVLLGSRNQLYQVDQNTGPTLLRHFDAPIEISGLARDVDGDLLLLDRAGRRLLETQLF